VHLVEGISVGYGDDYSADLERASRGRARRAARRVVVDDDGAFRGVAVRLLGGMGFTVVAEAGTCASAAAAAERHRPDAALARPGGPRVALTSSDPGDAEDFLRRTLAHRPDVAVVDVQMPPRNEDDGLRAAMELRASLPATGVLVLSHVTRIFSKLGLGPTSTEHRRVPAVLTYVRSSHS
jgi:CheY-like chemotaxis protein